MGPIISGALTETIGFRNGFDMTASLVLVFTVTYMIVNVRFGSILKLNTTQEVEDDCYIRYKEPEI